LTDCSGGFTSGNKGASASILRFLRDAILVPLIFFGVLVVLVVALGVVF
jgi:hypothetical protein